MSPTEGASRPASQQDARLRALHGDDAPPVDHAAGAAPLPGVPRAGQPSAAVRDARGLRRPGWWPAWGLRTLNGGLACVILVELAWLVSVVVTPPAVVTEAPGVRPPPAARATDGAASSAAPATDALPSLERAAAREVFHTDGVFQESGLSRSAAAATGEAAWNLIGIVPGSPAQAILEDAQTKKTYVVRQGQHVPGGWTVDRIADGYVILDANGDKTQLSL